MSPRGSPLLSPNIRGSSPRETSPEREKDPNNSVGNECLCTRDNAKKAEEMMKEMIVKLDKSVDGKLKRGFVIVNLYYYFQGVILTAVAKVSSPKCHQWYIFSALSLIPFLLHVVPLIMTVFGYFEDKKKLEGLKLQFEHSRLTPGERNKEKNGNHREYMNYVLAACSGFLLFVFNGLIMYACYSLLCVS